MATVYVGQLLGPVGFSRVVAIKRMHEEYASDRKFVAMFVDEAWLAARVQHPNVVSTIDVVADAGELFIVMEYIRGESLSSALKMAGGPMPPAIAAGVISQILGGLHAAHEAKDESGRPLGMIHRDTSPQNILLGTDGLARITDFGIAKAASRLQVTQTKEIKGKLRYMPPEQIVSDEKLDRRADIYATGVVLWEALAGRTLFAGESVDEVVRSIIHDAPLRLNETRSDISAGLDQVIGKAIARQASARFTTAEEFQIALEGVVPLASSRVIGEWVQQIAATSLRDKKAAIDLIEHAMKSRRGVTNEVDELSAPQTVLDPVPVPHSQATTVERQSGSPKESQPGPRAPAPIASPLHGSGRGEPSEANTAKPRPLDPPSIFDAPVVGSLPSSIAIDEDATVDRPPVGFEATAAAPRPLAVPRAMTVLPESAVPGSDEATTRRGAGRGATSTIALQQIQGPVAPYAPESPKGGSGSDEDATVRSAVPVPKRTKQAAVAATLRLDNRNATMPSALATQAMPPVPMEGRSPLRRFAPYILLGVAAVGGAIAATSWFESKANTLGSSAPIDDGQVAPAPTAPQPSASSTPPSAVAPRP
jgi:serine/threonine protein kinase